MSTGAFGIEAVTGPLNVPTVISNILTVMLGTITLVCIAIFIAGAFFLTISAGDEQRKSLGKDLMIGAVIGIIIVVAAKAILQLAFFFVYGA
jgi:hypothetical protein